MDYLEETVVKRLSVIHLVNEASESNSESNRNNKKQQYIDSAYIYIYMYCTVAP